MTDPAEIRAEGRRLREALWWTEPDSEEGRTATALWSEWLEEHADVLLGPNVTADPEGWLATSIWRACLHNGHPITVPASRWAAATAIHHLGPPLPLLQWPALMVDLHENIGTWHDPARLAADLRRHADRLDRAHPHITAA